MSCFACDEQGAGSVEQGDEAVSLSFCPKCRAAIAQMEAEYRAELFRLERGSWEALEPRLQQGLASQTAERLAIEPHWQERLVVHS